MANIRNHTEKFKYLRVRCETAAAAVAACQSVNWRVTQLNGSSEFAIYKHIDAIASIVTRTLSQCVRASNDCVVFRH